MRRSRSLAVPLGFGLLMLALQSATITEYGWFRDELYYVASTDHLAIGYVDHPPLSIWVLALVCAVLGESLVAVRLLPALLGAAVIFLAGLIARELGGGRFAQAVTGMALVLTAYLALFHFYSMNALDLFFWTLAVYLLILALARDEPRSREWLLLGLALGLGLLNKISVLWLGLGLAVGLLLTPHRRVLRTRWPWLAAALALALFSPYLVWQVQHGWPTIEFIQNATGRKMVAVSPLEFLSRQAFVMNPVYLPLWLGGLLYCLLSREHRRWRILGWIYLTVAAVLISGGESRATYLAPAYPAIVASGAIALERFLDRRRLAWGRPLVLALMSGGVVLLPMALPVLPPEGFVRYSEALGMRPPAEERQAQAALPQHLADMFGWEEMAATVARVYQSLPPEERRVCRVFGQNYGEAGAIDVLGRKHGLPKAMSPHNSYWYWGPGDWSGEVLIVLGGDPEEMEELFEELARADTVRSPWAMPSVHGRPVWVARGLRVRVDEIWPRLRRFI